jgi:uncharacterized membrane protein (DUF4010 family)
LLGGIAGATAAAVGGVSNAGGGIMLAVALATYAAVITAFCRDENRADGTFSATTAVAAVLTFTLGAGSPPAHRTVPSGSSTFHLLSARRQRDHLSHRTVGPIL